MMISSVVVERLPHAGGSSARAAGALLGLCVLLWAGGCHDVPRTTNRPFDPVVAIPGIGKHVEQRRLRREVEADSFPAASQVGL